MINIADIKQLIEKPANADFIAKGVQIMELHNLHINGCELEKFIVAAEGIENKDHLKIRLQEAHAYTVPVMSEALNYFNKALKHGTVSNFEFKENSIPLFEKFEEDLDIFKDFIKKRWVELIKIDPNGLVFLEMDKDERIYPTYKSIKSIHAIDYDFEYKIKYIIFKPKELEHGKRSYRVIDKMYDYEIICEGSKYSVNDENTFQNKFGEVPATFISELIDSEANEVFTSYFSKSLIIANELLDLYTHHKVYEKRGLIPLHWAIKEDCPVCSGKGSFFDKGTNSDTVCPDCKGRKINTNRKLSDVLYIDFKNLDKDSLDPRNQPAGYVSPDLNFSKLMYERFEVLKNDLRNAIWGADSAIKQMSKDKTAYQVGITQQTVSDKLNAYSDNASEVLEFICRLFAKVKYPKTAAKVEIHFIKRFTLKTAEELLSEYYTAIEKGASDIVLNDIYKQYISVLHEADETELKKQILILECKPFFHYKTADLLLIMPTIENKDYLKNVYFNKFLNEMFNEKPFYLYSKDEINTMLDTYVNNVKVTPQIVPVQNMP